MGLFGFIKDVALLPIDIAADATGLGVFKKMIDDDNSDTLFMTVDRLKSLGKNFNETYDK